MQRTFEADLLSRVRIVEEIATKSVPVGFVQPPLTDLPCTKTRHNQCKPIVGHAHQPSRVLSCIAERL